MNMQISLEIIQSNEPSLDKREAFVKRLVGD